MQKDYKNIWVEDSIDGKHCKFRSKGEHRIAKYLQLLKETGQIKDWEHETHTFIFPDSSWLIDFVVRNNDNTFFYIEFKGHFEADTRRKLKLLDKYYPETKIVMAFYSKRDAQKVKRSIIYLDQIWVLTKEGSKTIYDKSIAKRYDI